MSLSLMKCHDINILMEWMCNSMHSYLRNYMVTGQLNTPATLSRGRHYRALNGYGGVVDTVDKGEKSLLPA
jgi:hypothetical protein